MDEVAESGEEIVIAKNGDGRSRGRRRTARSPDSKVLVFQHIPIEHPGIFRDFLRDDGVEWRAVELDAGESIPDLGAYDALWVMGGPMDVWEDDRHPWLEAERAAIREAVLERQMPFLGFCLGHQLLAQALGGEVGPAAEPEIGIFDVELTAAGRASPPLRGRAPRRMPACSGTARKCGGRRPAPGPLRRRAPARCRPLGVGGHAFSIQYHVEITRRTVPEWGAVPAYGQALQRALGTDALAGFETAAAAGMADFNRNARRLYDNFMRIVEGARVASGGIAGPARAISPLNSCAIQAGAGVRMGASAGSPLSTSRRMAIARPADVRMRPPPAARRQPRVASRAARRPPDQG